MAATTLRELIARVVFRADPSQLEAFDAKVDQLKERLVGVDAQAKKGIKPGVESAPIVTLSSRLRDAYDRAIAAARGVLGVGAALRQAATPAKGFGAELGQLSGVLGAFGAAAVAYKAIGLGRTMLAEAKQVGVLASQLGISTDALQTWTLFAEQAGASNEDLMGTVKALANNVRAAAEAADGPAASAFRKLGISTAGWRAELPGTMDVLLATGGALSDLENDTERLSVAQQLLGEAGLKLLPAFEGGAEGARKQLAALQDLAVVYSADFIKSTKEADKEMAILERQLKGVGAEILLAVLPSLRDLVRWLAPVARRVREVVRDSNALSAALGVGAAAGVLKLVGNLNKLVTVLKIGRGVLLKFVLPFLLLDDIISLLKGEESVIGDILDAMFGAGAAAAVVRELKAAWEGVKGANSSLWDTLGLVKDRLFETGEAGKMSAEEFEAAFLRASQGIGDAFDSLFDRLTKAAQGWKWHLFDRADDEAALEESARRAKETEAQIAGEREKQAALAARLANANANANKALALGGAPSVSSSSRTSTVTFNDHSTVTSNINGVDAQNVGPALRQTERNITHSLERNKATVVRQTVGAVSP